MSEVVWAFDRDGTIDTSAGPVPLDWVCRLAEEAPVYAIGNQALCGEADVPGIEHLRREVGDLDGSDADHVGYPAREARLRMVERLHPDADRYVHVDDIDVGAGGWDRWDYYTPGGFVEAVENGDENLP